MGGIAFDPSGNFGSGRDLFLCEFGTFYPMNSPNAEDADRGFRVVELDLDRVESRPIVENRHPGPASAHGSGGVERPIDCAFDPDGEALYVLDFGRVDVTESHLTSYGHTGVLWRVVPERSSDRGARA